MGRVSTRFNKEEYALKHIDILTIINRVSNKMLQNVNKTLRIRPCAKIQIQMLVADAQYNNSIMKLNESDEFHINHQDRIILTL